VPEPGAVRLADSSLWLVPESDDCGGPDRILPGFGNTMRDGLGVRAERGGVEIAVVGGLLADAVLGVRATSLGIAGGRVVAIGRAGNPDTMDGVEVVLDTATAVIDATGMIVTPGGVDPHVHWLSPQVADAALAGGITTLVIQDYGPIWNLGANPAEGLAATWAALEAHPVNAALLVRASSSRPEPVEAALRAGGAGLKIHEDVGAGPEQIRCALDLADAHDVQLAIHTDGLNEALSVEDTYAAFGGRTVHAFHIEGAGGGHAPDLLALAGRERVLTSSTSPTVPFGAAAPWWPPCTCSSRASAPATGPPCATASARGRWPPRACSTTSA
jgi:urease subunit alpha